MTKTKPKKIRTCICLVLAIISLNNFKHVWHKTTSVDSLQCKKATSNQQYWKDLQIQLFSYRSLWKTKGRTRLLRSFGNIFQMVIGHLLPTEDIATMTTTEMLRATPLIKILATWTHPYQRPCIPLDSYSSQN